MSAWRYLRLIWGLEKRDKFIKKTIIRQPHLERVYDDKMRDDWYPEDKPSVPTRRDLNLKNVRQYSTIFEKESWTSIWGKMSKDDKLQTALSTHNPPNAEIAYYKGLAFKDFGVEFSGEAMSAFKLSLELCGVEDTTTRNECESEIRLIERDSITQNEQRKELL